MDNAQKELLNRIRVCDFVLVETALFLDSHPQNEAALAYYKEHLAKRKAAAADYAARYGMLSMMDCPEESRWSWVDGPWPWEYRED